MSWLILSLLALTCFVVYDVAGRFFATRSQDPRAFAVIYNALVAIMAPLLFLFDQTLPHDLSPKVIILTIIGLIIWGLFGRYEYYARKNTEASIFTITIKLAPVANFFLALFVFQESLTISKLAGIVLIIIANLLLFVGQAKGSVISLKGLKYMLMVSGFLALGWLFDAMNVKFFGVAIFSILSFAVPSLISAIFPLIKKSDLSRELELTPWWQFVLLGLSNLTGYGLMLKALTLGPASNVMPIITSTSPFVVLFGVILLGESKHLSRKVFASILTLIAIYLMR